MNIEQEENNLSLQHGGKKFMHQEHRNEED